MQWICSSDHEAELDGANESRRRKDADQGPESMLPF